MILAQLQLQLVKGEASLKKNGKIWEKFPIRLDPLPSDNSELFEFQKFLKTSEPPPPLGSNSELFDFQTFLIKVILQTALSNN